MGWGGGGGGLSQGMCLCSGVFASMNLINNLPDLVLCFVFSYLTAFIRICKVSCVCKRWHNLMKSLSRSLKCVNFSWQRKITSEVLETYVFPGSTKVLLDECCYCT